MVRVPTGNKRIKNNGDDVNVSIIFLS